LNAFDELEMIVEGIDNASNMDRMNLWPEIFACITAEESVSVVKFALWIIGTCAQNNPEAQDSLINKHSIISRLLDLWKERNNGDEDSITIHAKILYCLTSILSNNPAGLKNFAFLDGFSAIEGFQESSEALRSKMSFFLCTVLGNEIGIESVKELIGDACPKLLAILNEGPSEE
jgi:hsp70-interacting protein